MPPVSQVSPAARSAFAAKILAAYRSTLCMRREFSRPVASTALTILAQRLLYSLGRRHQTLCDKFSRNGTKCTSSSRCSAARSRGRSRCGRSMSAAPARSDRTARFASPSARARARTYPRQCFNCRDIASQIAPSVNTNQLLISIQSLRAANCNR